MENETAQLRLPLLDHGKEQDSRIEMNVLARKVANEVVEMGCTLALEEGLNKSPEHVRKMWQCVMEIAADLIGDKVLEENKPPRPPSDPVQAPVCPTLVLEGGCVPDSEPFPFGKHGPEQGGLSYGEVPDGYYGWLSNQDWIDRWPEVLEYIQFHSLDE